MGSIVKYENSNCRNMKGGQLDAFIIFMATGIFNTHTCHCPFVFVKTKSRRGKGILALFVGGSVSELTGNDSVGKAKKESSDVPSDSGNVTSYFCTHITLPYKGWK